MGRVAVACALALAVLVPQAGARRAKPSEREAAVVAAPMATPDTRAPVPVVVDTGSAARVAIRRAAFAHARGDFAGVVAVLAPLSPAALPHSDDADRAAFLLGHAWLRLGQLERFDSLARTVAKPSASSPFTRWLNFKYHLNRGATGAIGAAAERPGGYAADALVADRLLEAGDAGSVTRLIPAGVTDPLLLHLRVAALERLGEDAGAELQAIAASDSTTELARDLAGLALVRLATRAADRGEDPRPILARVPGESRYAPRARHMAALATLERGDTTAGRHAILEVADCDSLYEGHREAMRTAAGLALDRGDWDEAFARYLAADADWQLDRARLLGFLAPGAAGSLWRTWERDRSLSDVLVLDGVSAASLAERLATEAADLTAAPGSRGFALTAPPAPDPASPRIPPPAGPEWSRITASADAVTAARGELALALDSLDRERAGLSDQRRYLGHGLRRVREEGQRLARDSRWLDSLQTMMDSTAQRLLALRDAATLRFQRRAALLIARAQVHEGWAGAMDHFHLRGPDGERHADSPPGWKGPDVVVAQERELAQSIRFAAARVHEGTPERTAGAYEKTWGPRLIDRANLLAEGTRGALAWARALEHSVDSNLALAQGSAEERRLAARVTALGQRAERLAAADAALRDTVARAAVAAALRALEDEREALDYGLAAASWARAVRLSAADTLPLAAVVGQGGQPADPYAAGSDSLSRHDRELAIARISVFLADHPGSAARGEMRFRLADLLVTQARTDFRARMEGWLAARAEGRDGRLPVVDHDQALALYRHILDDDADHPHRDAVLFNAGMLLADAGDPEAAVFFRRLLAEHPSSGYVQEASLRLGDLAFDGSSFDEGVDHYQRAAGGGDPSLVAIALYKSGWAHYNADRWEAAAQAFRGVLDLYASDTRLRVQADIEQEAEQYFVYSLAAAGGAEAFERAFPRGAERPYERRVLRAMGQHFRRYGEFTDAAAVDRLYLERWPSDPAALDVVGRLAESQRRAERPAEERATRLEWAERFAPGGTWASAQASDSLRREGEAFARTAWRSEAFDHHRRARGSGSPEEWRAALRHYQTLLQRWPEDSSSAVFELHAGEASAELGEFAGALEHYRRAAARGRDSVATRAAWQRVAVTDRWYESTRSAAAAGRPRGTGRDSLARAVMAAADTLLAGDPQHAQAADLVWRQCQLAVAHGWTAEAGERLGRFVRTFPADRRAPLAANERAQVHVRAGDFEAAGRAFEEALAVARRAGVDSLARQAERALPVCAYRAAEAAVAADSTKHERHAELFAEVAKRWPEYEHAAVAQYRAGLAWLDGGRTGEAAKALAFLAERWPRHKLARESRLRIAQSWEAAGERERASAAWIEYATRHSGDKDAPEAWLRAAELSDSAGQGRRADELRAEYLKRWPADEDAALEILEKLASREVAALGPKESVAPLLRVPKPKQGAPAAAAAPVPYLAQYLKRVAKRPGAVSKPLMAQVRFRLGEEAFTPYRAAGLTQPLPPSIAAKQKLLDSVLVRYRRTVDTGVTEWAHAATYRIGEALMGFGEALEKSERPADLTGDDLAAYENVLLEQAMTFHDRGESVWSDLLQRTRGGSGDAWTARAQEALWSRLGQRFMFQAESEFPVIEARGPGRARAGRVGGVGKDTLRDPRGPASSAEDRE
jgi:outer membrane protein assembly factor BamD (BamD/ComL family)